MSPWYAGYASQTSLSEFAEHQNRASIWITKIGLFCETVFLVGIHQRILLKVSNLSSFGRNIQFYEVVRHSGREEEPPQIYRE